MLENSIIKQQQHHHQIYHHSVAQTPRHYATLARASPLVFMGLLTMVPAPATATMIARVWPDAVEAQDLLLLSDRTKSTIGLQSIRDRGALGPI